MASSSASIQAPMHDFINDYSYSLDELKPPLRSDLEPCVCRNRWHRQELEKDLEIKLLNQELKIQLLEMDLLKRQVEYLSSSWETDCRSIKIQLLEMDLLKRQVEYLSSSWETDCRSIKIQLLEMDLLKRQVEYLSSSWETDCRSIKIQLLKMDSLKRQVEYFSSGWETDYRSIKDFCSAFELSTPSATSEKTPSGAINSSGIIDTSGINGTSTTSEKTPLRAIADAIEFNLENFFRRAKGCYEVDAQTAKSWTELSSEKRASSKKHDGKQINPMFFYEMIEKMNNIFD